MSQRIGDNNDGLLDSWSKRVRVLGLNPTMPNDLIACVFLIELVINILHFFFPFIFFVFKNWSLHFHTHTHTHLLYKSSMLFSIVFLGLLLGCGVVCRQRAYRSTSIYILSVGTLLTFLGFAIRAGISTSQNPTRLSFVFESMFLIIGEICIVSWSWLFNLLVFLLASENQSIDRFWRLFIQIDFLSPFFFQARCVDHACSRWVARRTHGG